MIDPENRKFKIAHGVRISADPETMGKDRLVDEVYDLGNYASSLQTQIRALRAVLHTAMKKGLDND